MDVHEFTRRIEINDLLAPDSVQQLKADVATADTVDLTGLTQRLVKGGALTPFQIECLTREPPTRLRYGEYLLLDRIGQGGMGAVYKVRRRGDAKMFALKILSMTSVKDIEAENRFRREVEAASQLSHPHLVAAIDSGSEEDQPYYVMEYVPGNNLSEVVKTHGPLPLSTAVNCMIHASLALSYVHTNGIAHRDVKPSNLMLDTAGNVRIVDLGLARLTQPNQDDSGVSKTALTKTGAVLGTVDYMSPEQAVNTRKADHRSDIYSLGCTLHYLLTGQAPFHGDTMMEVLVAHREDPIPSLRAARPEVPHSLERLSQHMLAKKPGDRPRNMEEVLKGFESLKQEHGMAWIMDKMVAKRKR